MHGTLICAVTDGAENDDAVAQAVAISERLGLRLVLTHVVDGIGGGNGDGEESFTMKGRPKRVPSRGSRNSRASTGSSKAPSAASPSATRRRCSGRSRARRPPT